MPFYVKFDIHTIENIIWNIIVTTFYGLKMYIKIAYLLYTKIHKYVQAIVDFHEHNIIYVIMKERQQVFWNFLNHQQQVGVSL